MALLRSLHVLLEHCLNFGHHLDLGLTGERHLLFSLDECLFKLVKVLLKLLLLAFARFEEGAFGVDTFLQIVLRNT